MLFFYMKYEIVALYVKNIQNVYILLLKRVKSCILTEKNDEKS